MQASTRLHTLAALLMRKEHLNFDTKNWYKVISNDGPKLLHTQTSNLTFLPIISYKMQLGWSVISIWPNMLLYSCNINSWLPCGFGDVNKATSTAVRCSVGSNECMLLTVVTVTCNIVLLLITSCTYITNNFTFLWELHFLMIYTTKKYNHSFFTKEKNQCLLNLQQLLIHESAYILWGVGSRVLQNGTYFKGSANETVSTRNDLLKWPELFVAVSVLEYTHVLAVQWLINTTLFHGSMWNKYKFTWAILTPDQQQGAPPVCLPNFSFYYSWCHDSPL